MELTAYTRSGTERYGALNELGDTKQDLTMSQDQGFTFSIDAGNAAQQMNIKQANKALKREIDEVITPTVDKYRLNAWCTHAGTVATVDAPDKANCIDQIMTATGVLDDALVPMEGRVLFVVTSFYKLLKQAPDFISVDKLGEKALAKGVVGEVDGMKVVRVPTSYMPANHQFLVKYKRSTVDPFQLKNYRIHKNPMGVDGDVVEGRIIHDSFVLDSKKMGLYAAKTAG